MKKLILALPLLLASCIGTPGTIPMADPVVRTIERVLDRHDAYVIEDLSLAPLTRDQWLADSASVRMIVGEFAELTPEVYITLLDAPLARHDAYVRMDMDLDGMEMDIYLESTERLRQLYEAVR